TRASMSVLLATGGGRYDTRLIQDMQSDLIDMIAGDLNGDKVQDLLTIVGAERAVSIWEGVGDGTFIPPPRGALVSGSAGMPAFGDLNGDERPDVVVPGHQTSELLVFFGA